MVQNSSFCRIVFLLVHLPITHKTQGLYGSEQLFVLERLFARLSARVFPESTDRCYQSNLLRRRSNSSKGNILANRPTSNKVDKLGALRFLSEGVNNFNHQSIQEPDFSCNFEVEIKVTGKLRRITLVRKSR